MNTAHRSICSYFHKLEFQPRTMVKPKLCSRGKHFHRAQPGSCRIVVASQSSRATMSCMLFVAASGLVYCMEHYWGGDRDHNINVILPAFERSITVKRFKCRKLTKIPQNHQACIYIYIPHEFDPFFTRNVWKRGDGHGPFGHLVAFRVASLGAVVVVQHWH